MSYEATKQPATDSSSVGEVSAELTAAEELVHEIRRLLVHSEGTLDEEGVKKHAETLERWLESYRRGLSAAQKLSENSDAFLQEMRERLKLALEEMQHLEDEGGTPATKEQKQRMEDVARAMGRIDHLTGTLGDASFKSDQPKSDQPQAGPSPERFSHLAS